MPLNTLELTQLLNTEEIAYLATADLQGNPHVKPIWFVYHEGKLWFETHLPTKAFKNIETNNKVSICIGGKFTYILWGSVKWYKEKDAPLNFRELLWKKYKNDMDDSYITEKTRIFEVISSKEVSWHYAPTWD